MKGRIAPNGVSVNMASTKITDNLYSVGILNPAMRIFDVIMKTDYGTSYNSYILKGENKTALIEVSHADFFESYLDNIKEVCDPSDIDYIVLNHCEPDHSGALAELLKHCNPKIVCTRAGSNFLKNIANRELDFMIVNDGDTIDLGGAELKFIPAAFLHWPDSMFTYCESEKVLFSCDMFGCHYCEPYMLDKFVAYDNSYDIALKGYYDAIFGPFKPHVIAGMKKIEGLEFDTICPSHGPILTKGGKLNSVLKKYKEWSAPAPKDKKTIPVFYCSAYGNTGRAACAICRGILKASSEIESKIYDINDYDMSELAGIINSSDAFAIGSPTINSDAVAPVWNLISTIDVINNRKKKALVFGSYGWSGEAIPNLISRLKGIKNDVFGNGFKFTFVPTDEDLASAEELGEEFAKAVLG